VSTGIVGGGSLVGIVVVRELGAAAEVDGARLAGGRLAALLVEDVYLAEQRSTDGAPVGEPLVAVAADEAVALGARVVLVPTTRSSAP
jgi:RES domain-containing protein